MKNDDRPGPTLAAALDLIRRIVDAAVDAGVELYMVEMHRPTASGAVEFIGVQPYVGLGHAIDVDTAADLLARLGGGSVNTSEPFGDVGSRLVHVSAVVDGLRVRVLAAADEQGSGVES